MKIKRKRMLIIAVFAGLLFLMGGQVSAANTEGLNYETFKNLENPSVEMEVLRDENLQQNTRILLFVILAVIVLLFVKIKIMIYRKEKEKEDRK